MKKIINCTIIAIASMAIACHKDATLTYLQAIGFKSQLKASASTVIMTSATDSSSVITFTWPAVVYPVKAHVTYTLQVDLPADTVGATAWSGATSVLIGNDILTKTYKGADFNALAIKAGITANDTAKLVFRIEAYQDRATYTNGVTVTVSPWAPVIPPSDGYPVLYLPGDYQGWSPGTAGTVAEPFPGVYTTSGVYEGYLYEPAGGTYHFKFTSAPDWNHINYGSAGAGMLSTDGLAGDLVLPGPGLYELSANTTSLTWTYTLITWAIIGDATPNGWGQETEMTYNPAKGTWSITLPMKTAGSFKFRANNAWNIDFGISPTDNKIYYADNPIFGGGGSKPGLNNLTVPSDGTYTLTLDIHDPNNYTYTAKKN